TFRGSAFCVAYDDCAAGDRVLDQCAHGLETPRMLKRTHGRCGIESRPESKHAHVRGQRSDEVRKDVLVDEESARRVTALACAFELELHERADSGFDIRIV